LPKYDSFLAHREHIGERGVAVCFNSLCASPMHYIQKELMRVEDFFYTYADYPDELDYLADSIAVYYNKVFDIAADCPAEIVLSGANYDSFIVTPPFFEKHIAGSLCSQARVLHEKGKLLLTHTDGENRGLLRHYVNSGFDVADSICPSPMTSQSLREIREAFDSTEHKITIWGGIPSICVLKDSMSDYEFDRYLYETMDSIGTGRHMIFSIADTTPPGAEFDRILKIDKIIKQFGKVNQENG